jgi:hypothetical protein
VPNSLRNSDNTLELAARRGPQAGQTEHIGHRANRVGGGETAACEAELPGMRDVGLVARLLALDRPVKRHDRHRFAAGWS